MNEEMHELCAAIHTVANRTEYSIAYFLDKIEAANEIGWSPETLPMIYLANDIRMLRSLADRIENVRNSLTAQTHAMAAE